MLGRGSEWLRWEPHIHAPGTILNDQFGASSWENYLTALETATPSLSAIGITDYYTTKSYERVLDAKRKGRLPHCELLFPNIEMRLSLGTVRGNWVNVHLLVNPEDTNHVEEIQRLLARLRFTAYDNDYGCTVSELIRLGRRIDPSKTEEHHALAIGVEQYKVSFQDLMDVYKRSSWAQENVLIAIAAGADGTSGLKDGADATLREEIERAAHIVFSGNPADRDFWLGLKPSATVADIQARYKSLKPVIWGSDAHDIGRAAKPALNRLCWVKGAATFDALKQVCVEPHRAYVGEAPPTGATPSQVITDIYVTGAPWLRTPKVPLNPGLVAIIGARGSGKTALADIVACGCDSLAKALHAQSFLSRANADDYLDGSEVELAWQEGPSVKRKLNASSESIWDTYPRARYLTQQFVDELCSSSGMTDALLDEIERVIFEASPLSDRDGANDFRELLEQRANRHREAREREESALADISDRIGTEIEKTASITSLKTQIAEKEQILKGYGADRTKLVPKGSDENAKKLILIMAAAEKVRGHLRWFAGRQAALLSVQDDVVDLRTNRAPASLRSMKERYKSAFPEDSDWNAFLLRHSGEVDAIIEQHQANVSKLAQDWKGAQPIKKSDGSYLSDNDIPDRMPLAILEAEINRLEQLVASDKIMAHKLAAISKRISDETIKLQSLRDRLTDCQGAPERRRKLTQEREAGYRRVFEAVLAEENVLKELYAPLMQRLDGTSGSIRKLSFSVARVANIEQWAKRGEDFIDMRKNPFKGRGSLKDAADIQLRTAWEAGDANAVTEAMTQFRSEYVDGMVAALKILPSDSGYRNNMKRFAQWLYSTDHITLRYSIDFDGVDIQRLSPGTRGIVLLLLYLAMDQADDRPLIIDQPEENLDPKSIFDELVGLFQTAKSKRQVIMVTHNANLVVNADADQIIIANVGPYTSDGLPPISYISGGLDEAPIRKSVCDILEGGEMAFKERARRLRVTLDR